MAGERRVSVIIPSYGRNNQVIRAVRSVLDQGDVIGEILVVDDGSPQPLTFPDDSGDTPVRILRHATNKGASAARNTAISEARFDLIAFLDSDDVWRRNKMVRHLSGYVPDADSGLWASATGFATHDVARGKCDERIPIPADDLLSFSAGCWFCPSTLIMPRQAFDQLGLFDTTLARLEDYEWFLRFALAGGRLIVCPEVLADIYVARRGRALGYGPSAERIEITYGKKLTDLAARRNMFAYMALERAADHWRNGHYVGLAWWLARSLALKPRLAIPLQTWWRTPQQTGGLRD